MKLPKKNVVYGWDFNKWSIGFEIHKIKELGTVVEINFFALKFYWRIRQPK